MKQINYLLPNSLYGTSKFCTTIPYKFDEDGNIINSTARTVCREQAIGYFSTQIKNGGTKGDLVKSLNKARVVIMGITGPPASKISLQTALKVIHSLEDKLGYPRTSVKYVNVMRPNGNGLSSTAYMFEGCIKWYRSSHTMSLYHLILRFLLRDSLLIRKSVVDVHDFDSFLQFVNTAEELKKSKDCMTSGASFAIEDRKYVLLTAKYWLPLMQNLDSIYSPKVPWVKRFDAKKVLIKNGHYLPSINNEGIFNLVDGKAHHKSANIFKELVIKKDDYE